MYSVVQVVQSLYTFPSVTSQTFCPTSYSFLSSVFFSSVCPLPPPPPFNVPLLRVFSRITAVTAATVRTVSSSVLPLWLHQSPSLSWKPALGVSEVCVMLMQV